MAKNAQTDRTFPYVGASGWLTKLHQLCVRSMPRRVEVDWLTAPDRLGLSQPNARQILSFMQKVGWIDGEGSVSEEGKKLRLDGELWKQAMRDTTQRLYPDLLKQIESANEFSPRDVEQFFVAATDMGHSGRQQMMAVFRWFLREAGLTELEEKVWGRTRRGGQRRAEVREERPRAATPAGRKQAKPKTEVPPQEQAPIRQDTPATDPRLSTIASVLKINIDGTWEEDRMEAAFRMLDMLLKGKAIDG